MPFFANPMNPWCQKGIQHKESFDKKSRLDYLVKDVFDHLSGLTKAPSFDQPRDIMLKEMLPGTGVVEACRSGRLRIETW